MIQQPLPSISPVQGNSPKQWNFGPQRFSEKQKSAQQSASRLPLLSVKSYHSKYHDSQKFVQSSRSWYGTRFFPLFLRNLNFCCFFCHCGNLETVQFSDLPCVVRLLRNKTAKLALRLLKSAWSLSRRYRAACSKRANFHSGISSVHSLSYPQIRMDFIGGVWSKFRPGLRLTGMW